MTRRECNTRQSAGSRNIYVQSLVLIVFPRAVCLYTKLRGQGLLQSGAINRREGGRGHRGGAGGTGGGGLL